MLRLRVPASTTNLAHGFDCLGIALGCANTIGVTWGGDGVTAPGSADPGLAPMAARVREVCGSAWKAAIPGFAVTVAGDVPIARGMGSSATILIGVAAACRLHATGHRDLDDDDRASVLELAAGIEGHPDNVAAACLGGVVIVGQVGPGLRWARFAVPRDLVAVVAIPPFEVKTAEARKILPQQLSRSEAVTGWQRTALIAAALAQGRSDDLRGLFADAWHERYRATVNPGFAEARAAAASAGAIGTIISGSGSSVLSFSASADAEAVRDAMLQSYRDRGVAAEVRILPFDNGGARVIG